MKNAKTIPSMGGRVVEPTGVKIAKAYLEGNGRGSVLDKRG